MISTRSVVTFLFCWLYLVTCLAPVSADLSTYIQKNPYISLEVWEKVSPFLLPDNHPAKDKLDQIFSKSRVIQDTATLAAAGFVNPKVRAWTRLIVTKHPEIPGYIFKIYSDQEGYYKNLPEHTLWILRIEGAEMTREYIQKKGWSKYFKVPKKWIYPLPGEPSPSLGYLRKNFVLVEEDMHICSDKKNREKYKGDKMTASLLKKIYTITTDLGLNDCAKPANLPFCKDGKLAFVDTQSYHKWPIMYFKMTEALSPSLQIYWKHLVKASKQAP